MAKRTPPHGWPYPFTRLYGAVTAGRIACPKCGRLLQFRAKGSHVRTGSVTVFDPLTSRIKCSSCGKRFQVGLLVWNVSWRGGRHRRPPDQRPTPQELAQLRGLAEGFWMDEEYPAHGGPLNRYADMECSCATGRETCPVHGLEAHHEEGADDDAG